MALIFTLTNGCYLLIVNAMKNIILVVPVRMGQVV